MFNLLNPYYWVIQSKNQFYQWGLIKGQSFNLPVFSVGNLTTGGTGKTPFVLMCLKLILKQNPKLKILVVSKSYKAKTLIPVEVVIDNLTTKNTHTPSAFFGDEPVLIKQNFQQVTVWAGPHKTQTLAKALAQAEKTQLKYDLVLVDDGFSHRQLKKRKEILLIDVSRDLCHYKILPLGHLREPLSELKRADVIFLTKVEQAQPQTLEFFKEYLVKLKKSFYLTQSKVQLDCAPQASVYLFSALGHPKVFEKQIQNLGFKVSTHKIYNDHYQMSASEEAQLLQNYLDLKKENDSLQLVCSEKDFVKLSNTQLKNLVTVAKLEFNISDSAQRKLYEIFSS